jgi:GAF domain-containing protein
MDSNSVKSAGSDDSGDVRAPAVTLGPPARTTVDANEPGMTGLEDGLLAFASLTRALGGTAELVDVGSLLWILLRQIVRCDAMALFLPDEAQDHVVIRFAAGAHAHALHGVTRPTSQGIAGWVAVHRTSVLNAEPILDLGFRATATPPLRSSLVIPLIDSDALIAILALYSTELLSFTDHHQRVLELLAPRLAAALIDAVIADEDSLYPAQKPVAALKLVKNS